MRLDDGSIREFLAAALGNKPAPWPVAWNQPQAISAVGETAIYHGIAGLLVEQAPTIGDWPAALADRLRDHARAQAMWELRHHQLLGRLLAALPDHGVRALLLKGSAIAYDLYENPASRSRGDSDVLVRAEDVEGARAALQALGYSRFELHDGLDDELAQQESWTVSCEDGSHHGIDLHWQVLNSHSLRHVLPVEECFARPRPLPRLSASASTLDRPRFLLHTCVHRAMHRTAPYFVEGKAHFGEGRLIWSWDVALMAQALTAGEWPLFAQLAVDKGVAGACLAGLQAASDDFGAAVPRAVLAALQGAGTDRYLGGSALQRAWADLRSVPGGRAKWRFLRGRLLPARRFMRAKYPGMARAPLILLYARRLAESLRR